MIIIGRAIGMGRDKGDVEKDEEGIPAVKLHGKRMAWCLLVFDGKKHFFFDEVDSYFALTLTGNYLDTLFLLL